MPSADVTKLFSTSPLIADCTLLVEGRCQRRIKSADVMAVALPALQMATNSIFCFGGSWKSKD